MKEHKIYRFFPGFLTVLFILGSATAGFSQEGVDTPLFPAENENIIFVEGESAVATNFAVEPTLNFRASGSRTLQLNRTLGLQGSAPFFAEFAFFIPEEGTYRLGYGGTPPGPEQDLLPSYTSPVSLVLDNGEPVYLYREHVRVTERYLPTLYWIDVGPVELTAGVHTLRFQVSEKRRYDGRYLFYLDAFYLVREESLADPGIPPSRVFPGSLQAETDIPFKTISEYEQEDGSSLSLSYVYSLLGDNVNALKTLRQLRLEEPDNADYIILAAKNRLWKGDVQEGLRLYSQALDLDPAKADNWNEAGKIAAWTGSYQESINFYTGGLEHHPDNLSLLINLGITHLWKAEEKEAEAYFSEAAELTKGNLNGLLQLGEIFRINGYPDRAEKIYREGIKQFPLALEPYLQLIEIYNSEDETADAQAVFESISQAFPSSDRLTTYLETFETKQNLREETIAFYRAQVDESPDNLLLRELLVQTYFWNGKRQEAITEYLNILTNHTYRALVELDTETRDILKILDFANIYLGYFKKTAAAADTKMREITGMIRTYAAAAKKYQTLLDKESAPEEELNAARDETAKLLKETADAILTQQQIFDTAGALQISYRDLVQDLEPLLQAETEEQERFETLVSPTGWSWDRTFHMLELQQTLISEPQLAGHVLGTVFRIEGKYPQAEQGYLLTAKNDSLQDPAAAGLLENRLWQGDWQKSETAIEKYGEQIARYADYFTELIKFFTELQRSEEVISFVGSAEELESSFQTLSVSFEETKTALQETVPAVQKDIGSMRAILMAKMVRKWYALESNTYLLRYELGKYLIAEENYVEATRQLEKVLDIDPWNIDAKFRLGVVRQHYGDWKSAMKRYRSVYLQDPFYPNAAAYYNLLARQHPDTFSVSTQLIGDTSRITFSADLAFETAITSVLSWNAGYEFDNVRLFKTYGDEIPSSHQLHHVKIGFPIDLYFINLTLTPGAGLYFTSDLFQQYPLSTSDSVLEMNSFLTFWDIYPALTGKIVFAPKFLTLTADYAWKPVEETFVPGRVPFREHDISLNAYASFGDLEVPFLQYSSGRIYGQLRLIDDNNMIGSAVEELNFGIHLFDVPWTTLIIGETFSFEHSAVPSLTSDNGYYAPDSVLVFKGGLLGSSWISLLNQNVLGVIIGGYIGGYWEQLILGAEPAMQVELNSRFELVKGPLSYYLSLQGSHTSYPATKELLYWSLSINLGISGRPDRQLTQ